jgi:hypothetical protein
MTIRTSLCAVLVSIVAHAAAAQPARPVDAQPRSVTMPLSEYNRLLDLAARVPAPAPAAPVPAIVSAADVRITVDRETARGVFALSGQVLQSGIARVPLMNSTAISDATAAGPPVPLIADGPMINALLSGPAPFAVSLQWGGALAFSPGRAGFTLPVPQAGAVRATIELPGEQADVHLSPGLITRRSIANSRTIIEATLDPGSTTQVWWSMRDSAPAAAVKDVRALAEVMTLITLDDSDARMAALVDISVTQGELRRLTVQLPAGFVFQSVNGSTLEDSDQAGNDLILTFGNPALRSHQFLINLERPHAGGSFDLDTGVISLKDVQRERGEIAIEGVGTMDLAVGEQPNVHRMDVRELNSSLHALARLPILSAFRYQRASGTATPHLALAVKRFADAGVLAAAADSGTATTLITSEGRALTEIRLDMRNRSQPFLKVELPPGATIVSVDLAGESAKPALGADGTRIPLMRAGLRTSLPYTVSFVYVHAGVPFQKKGDIALSLPKMDVPIGVMNWEIFVPESYRARMIGGNVIEFNRFALSETITVTGVAPKVAGVFETVTVESPSPVVDVRQQPEPPSQNVVNLQARAAGVLPIRVDVPKAGVSHEFIKPLLVAAETTVTLRYKRN